MSPSAKNKTTIATDYAVKYLTTSEAGKMFDKEVRQTFKVSAKQFIENYRKGKYDDRDDCELMSLLMLLPFTDYSQQYGEKQGC